MFVLASLFAIGVGLTHPVHSGVPSSLGLSPLAPGFEHRVLDSSINGADCKFAADYDVDGYVDVAAGGFGPLRWYRYPGWTPVTVAYPQTQFKTDGQSPDVDGDGDPDLLLPDGPTGRIQWFQNPELPSGNAATDPWIYRYVGIHGNYAHDLEAGDVDGDGRIDAVTRGNGITKVFIQTTNPTAPFDAISIQGIPGNEGLALGDLDADGDQDLVVNGAWAETPASPSTSSWTVRAIGPSGATWASQAGIALGDVTADGRLDVFFAPSESAGPFSLFQAPADPSSQLWEETVISPMVEYYHTFKTADMNRDGWLDVVTAETSLSSGSDDLTVWTHLGTLPAQFVPSVFATTGSHNLRVVDLGADGNLDVVGANFEGSGGPLEAWVSRGVARLLAPPATIAGQQLRFTLFDPAHKSAPYLLAVSVATGVTPLPWSILDLPLAPDFLLLKSLVPPFAGLVSSLGSLDPAGIAFAYWTVPPAFVGWTFHAAFLTWTSGGLAFATGVSDRVAFTVY